MFSLPQGVNYYLDNIGSSLTLNGTGFVLQGNALVKQTHYFNKVYGQDDPFPSLLADLLGPAISKFLQGYNESIITLGSSGCGKTYALDRLLAMFATRVYSDVFKKQRPVHSDGSFRLDFQAFEIYGELARDLLQNQKDGLSVQHDELKGYFIPGIATLTLDSPEKIKNALDKVSKNRSSTKDNSMGEKVIVVYRFTLHAASASVFPHSPTSVIIVASCEWRIHEIHIL